MKKTKNKAAQELVGLRWSKKTTQEKKLVSVKLHEAKELKRVKSLKKIK